VLVFGEDQRQSIEYEHSWVVEGEEWLKTRCELLGLDEPMSKVTA
jgi:hypothetical protein